MLPEIGKREGEIEKGKEMSVRREKDRWGEGGSMGERLEIQPSVDVDVKG